MAADLKAAFNGFTVAGVSEDGTSLVLRTSGALPSLLSATSGAIKVQPAAFYQTGVGTPAVLVTSYVGNVTTIKADIDVSGLTRVIRLTLTDGIFKETFTSGMFTFDNAETANETAIQSGIIAENIERVSDVELLITAASGLVADSDLDLLISSGAFISTGTSESVAGVATRFVALKDLTAVAASAAADEFIITLSQAIFRTTEQGFSPSDILVTSSGTSLAAASNASVIRAALLNGDFVISSSEAVLTISTGIQLDIALDSIKVEVLPAALIQGANTSTEASFDLTTN
jgi:hypothetical protein